MIPLTLKMRNFLSYRGETPIFDFRTLHIACISGENGAGKSSFLEAIHWALWGKARIDDTGELISRGESTMSVELVFEVNSMVYRVTRSHARERKNITKLDLSQASDTSLNQWILLNGSTITETQLKITRDIVGMSYDIFQNSAYLRQGKADAFVQLTSTARREVIAEILEITRYEAFQKEAKRRRDEHSATIETLRGRINDDERITAEIPQHTALLSEHEDKLNRAKSFKVYADAVESYRQKQHLIDTLAQQQHDRKTRLKHRESELTAIMQALSERPQIEARYAEYNSYLATVKSLEQRQQLLIPLNTQRTHAVELLRSARTDAEKRIIQLQANINYHATLYQEHAEITALRDALQAEINQAADTASTLSQHTTDRAALQQQLDTIQQQILTYQTDETELQRLTQRIDVLQHDLADYEAVQSSIEDANAARERLSILERIVGDYRAQEAALTKELNTIKDQADKLKARRDTIQAGAPCPTCQTVMDDAHLSHAHQTFDEQLNEMRTTYADRKQQRKELLQQMHDAEQEMPHHQALIQQLKNYQQRFARLESQKQQVIDAEQQANVIRMRLETTPLRGLESQREALQHELGRIDARINQLRDAQTLQHARQQQLAQYSAQHARITAQLQQRDSDITQLAELEHLLASNQIGAEYQGVIAQLDSQIVDIGFDEAALQHARHTLETFGDIHTQYGTLQTLEATRALTLTSITDLTRDINQTDLDIQAHQQEYQRTLRIIETLQVQFSDNERSLPVQQMQRQADAAVSNYTDMVGRMRERLHAAEQALLRLEENREKLQTIEQQYRRFDTLASAFSSKGIQAMLINEYALPALEHEANRLLGRMTDNQLYLSFKTHHLTKQGNQQEVLEIEVSDAVGTRPLEAFSGGEAFRISFALRIALSKLLAHRAGRRLETLIIDEGFGTQDAQGRERLVEAINSISDEFRTILVITHVSEVRDMFPTQIHIRRTSQTSLWEISA